MENIVKRFWCATDRTGNYVNMTFSQPVVIEGIISSGATSNNSQVYHYVSDFTILHSKTVNGPLKFYSAEVSVYKLCKLHIISIIVLMLVSNVACTLEFHCNVFGTKIHICGLINWFEVSV